MAGPALVVVAGFATLYLAVKTEDGLVVDDYYRQGLAINATLARKERAKALGIRAVMQVSTGRETVQIRFQSVSIGPEARLRLRLVHPTRSGQDQSVSLLPVAGGAYGSAIRPLGPGAWRVLLEDEKAGWRVVGTLQAGQDGAELGPQEEQ